MAPKTIEVKSDTETVAETNEEILNKLFPIIVNPLKKLYLWPASPVPWKRFITVFIFLSFAEGPIIVYAIKNKDDFLEASYAICEINAGFIFYGMVLNYGLMPKLFLEVIDDLLEAWKRDNRVALPGWIEYREKLFKNVYKFVFILISYYTSVALKVSLVTITTNLFRVFVLKKDEPITFGYHADFIVNVLDPFDPIGYSLLLIPLIPAFVGYIANQGFVTVLYAMTIYYTGVLFRMVCIQINYLDEKLSNMKESGVLRELKFIVASHQQAIKTAGKLERVVRYPILVQVLVNSFFICLCGFDIFAVPSTGTTIINLAAYGVAMLMQLFLVFYVSDALTRMAAEVPNSIWNMKWYTQSPKVRRQFLFMMLYGQKTIGVSAGKFDLISLNRFLQVLQAGVSYFTLMRHIYSRLE